MRPLSLPRLSLGTLSTLLSSVTFGATLDQNSDHLPPNFAGTDPKALFDALMELLPSKGEFETTEKFRIRTAQSMSQPFAATKLAGARPTDVFALETNFDQKGKYDADKGEMTISVITTSSGRNAEVELMGHQLSHSSYAGKNAFGVTKTIEKSEGESYYLLADNFKGLPKKGKYSFGFDLTFKMNAAEANQFHDHLRVIYAVALSSPYWGLEDASQSPTIDFPYDSINHKHLIHAHIKGIWVYAPTSGQVFMHLAVK